MFGDSCRQLKGRLLPLDKAEFLVRFIIEGVVIAVVPVTVFLFIRILVLVDLMGVGVPRCFCIFVVVVALLRVTLGEKSEWATF